MRLPFGHLPHQVNAAVARRRGAFELSFNHFRRTQVRHDRQGHIAVAGPVPLGQRVIVCAHHVQLELDIAELEKRSARRVGKQHFGVDPIGIEHREPRLRIVVRLGNFFVELRIGRERFAHQSRAIRQRCRAAARRTPTSDRPACHSSFSLNDMRNALAPLAGGHALGEIVAVKTRMGIGADKFMFDLHTFSLSCFLLVDSGPPVKGTTTEAESSQSSENFFNQELLTLRPRRLSRRCNLRPASPGKTCWRRFPLVHLMTEATQWPLLFHASNSGSIRAATFQPGSGSAAPGGKRTGGLTGIVISFYEAAAYI